MNYIYYIRLYFLFIYEFSEFLERWSLLRRKKQLKKIKKILPNRFFASPNAKIPIAAKPIQMIFEAIFEATMEKYDEASAVLRGSWKRCSRCSVSTVDKPNQDLAITSDCSKNVRNMVPM